MLKYNKKWGKVILDTNAHEFSCSQKPEGKWIIYKLALLFFYTAYTLVYLYLIIKHAFVPLGALIPLTLWIFVYFTWRYTSPDYKYKIDAGNLVFYVIYGKREHEKLRIHLKDAVCIAPCIEAQRHARDMKIKRAYTALPSKNESDAYGIIFEKNEKLSIFTFKVTRDTLKALCYYNKNTVI